MNPREEIEWLQRRIRALEDDLGQLKRRVATLEETLATAAVREVGDVVPPPVTIATPVTSATPMASVAPAASVESIEIPPVLAEIAPSTSPAADAETPAMPRPAPRAHRWRDWLEPLQLWPPSGEENAEVRLGAWWATRIGALLAVIGVVFLGIYVSREAAPWVRLAEVIAVTAGVLGLGGWLERKLPRFGAVVFGAGLALGYFCAFAAYAVAPMKVITSPRVATLCELAVVGGILAVAWRRNSQVVATMAVALGHVTAFLALRGGPAGFGPWVVLVLGIAAVTLRFARTWEAPSVLGMPLAWVFLLVVAVGREGAAAMSVPVAWFWGALYFVLYFMRDWLVAWRGGALGRLDRFVQVTNSSLAVAVLLVVTAQVGGSRLTQFYFVSAAVMLAAAVAWKRVESGQTLVAIFACKAAGLLGLGVIAAFEGHARSLVLLVQAFVLLVSARQSRVRGLRVATIITGAVALGFFMAELRPENAPLAAAATLVEVVFLAVAIAFVAALQRWLGLDAARTAFGSVVVGLAAINTVLTWNAQAWAPAIGVAMGALLFATAAVLRGWLPAAIAGAMLVVAAHVAMWDSDVPPFATTQLWLNELVLLAAAAGAAFGLARWSDVTGQRRAHGLLVALAGGTLIAVCFEAFPATLALAIAAGLSTGLVVLAERAPRWPLAAWSAAYLALGGVLAVLEGTREQPAWLWAAAGLAWAAPAWLVASRARFDTIRHVGWREWSPVVQAALATGITLLALRENLRAEPRVIATAAAALAVFALAWRPGLRAALEASWVIWFALLVDATDVCVGATRWLAFLASWAPAVVLANRERFGEVSVAPPFWRRHAVGVQVVLATSLGAAIALELAAAKRVAAFGVVAAVGWAVWRWSRVAAARTSVLVVVFAGWISAWFLATAPRAQGWGAGLAAVLATGVVVALLPFAIECGWAATWQRRGRWIASIAGLALVFYAFAVQRGSVAAHATVGWGLAAVGLFLAGLFARSRAHRLTGLAGLALCVPRAFLIDLDSTLHRIAAFVALGVVLLWVGFSYHRFRHLIVDEEKKL